MQDDATRKARKKRNGTKTSKLKRTRTFMVTVKDGVVTVVERKHVKMFAPTRGPYL
jgi:hypothetical protein